MVPHRRTLHHLRRRRGHQEKPLGFQSLERLHRDLPVGRADIATYVSKGARGTGIGRALATATMRLADEADLNSIRAVIQHRNDNAIQYYRSLGFQDYRSLGFQDDLSGTTKGAIELLFHLRCGVEIGGSLPAK
ncbi:N-acetyltransferase family protein [Rhodococcus qingshengii]